MDAPIDRQVSQTLLGITKLEALIEAPEGPLSPDVARLTTCAEWVSELRAVRRSLEQFARSSHGLTYVGFLGHYSAGKSSTINSIFDLNSKSDKRETDFHPTDVSVTFCTNPTNRDNVLGTHRRGQVAVGTYFIDSDDLKNFVVVDTPGAGDTAVLTNRPAKIVLKEKESFFQDRASIAIKKVEEMAWSSGLTATAVETHVAVLAQELASLCSTGLRSTIGEFEDACGKFQGVVNLGIEDVKSYGNSWNSTALTVKSWYSDPETKSNLLMSAANEFKDFAVQPCLNLFLRKKETVTAAKAGLQEIVF